MSVINQNITEQDLQETYQAISAIQKRKGHTDTEAHKTANLLTYAVFRGLITMDSVKKSIVVNAQKAFTLH